MRSTIEIKSIVASGEGYNAEFKRSIPSKVKEIAEEVCAFANAAGGIVLIGVKDTNEIVGTPISNAKRSAIQNSLNEITPHLNCTCYLIEIERRDVFVIEVPSGPQKPYVLSGAIYVRIGPNTQKLTAVEEMRNFFQQSDRIYFDEAPCYKFDVETGVETESIKEFRALANLSSGISDEQLLDNLMLYYSPNVFKNGAVLFFGKRPEQIFDTAVVRCVAFDGDNKTYIIDDKTFGGPLYAQYLQAMQWLKQKLNVRYIIEGSGPRKEVYEIPEDALKELVLNALSHRDYYDRGASITVELFDDRLEIVNPGGLVSTIPKEEFGKRSHSRNPLIFGLFVRMHMVERIGSGIKRVEEVMAVAQLPPPEFSTEGMFVATLKRPTLRREMSDGLGEKLGERLGEKLTGNQISIIEAIIRDNKITQVQLADAIGISTTSIENNLRKLRHLGVVNRIGPAKGGHWEVDI